MISGVGLAKVKVRPFKANAEALANFTRYRGKAIFHEAMQKTKVRNVFVDTAAQRILNEDQNGVSDRIVGNLSRREKIGKVLANSLRNTNLEAAIALCEEKGTFDVYIAGEKSNIKYMLDGSMGIVAATKPVEIQVPDELFPPKKDIPSAPATFTGMKLAGGVGIGKLSLYVGPMHGVEVKQEKIPVENLQQEVDRFRNAFEALARRYEERIAEVEMRFPNEKGMANLSRSMLEGLLKPFKQIIEDVISKEHVNAEFAVQKVYTSEISELRSIMDKESLDEKQIESEYVGIMGDLIVGLSGDFPERLSNLTHEPVILVADMILPQDALSIKGNVKGIIVNKGGPFSHAAIIAKGMGIPSVQINHIMRHVVPGREAIVDGEKAAIILNPGSQELEAARDRIKELDIMKVEIVKEMRGLESRLLSGERVKLLANVITADDLGHASLYGVEGIGLYRTDMQMGQLYNRVKKFEQLTPEQWFAYETELAAEYSKAVQFIRGIPIPGEGMERSVTIRTFDWGRDKIFGAAEKDPLGLAGIRVYEHHRPVIMMQLMAILRASMQAPESIKVMFPFIACYPDVVEAKKFLDSAKKELLKRELTKHNVLFNNESTTELEAKAAIKGISVPYNPALPFGIMLEVPGAAIEIPQMIHDVDFVSYGTNDLIQLLRGADRQNEKVASYYKLMVPSAFMLLANGNKVVIEACKEAGICGEMASYPPAIPPLLGMGFRSLSMLPKNIPAVKKFLRTLEMKDCRALAEKVVQCRTSEEAKNEVIRKYPELGNIG